MAEHDSKPEAAGKADPTSGSVGQGESLGTDPASLAAKALRTTYTGERAGYGFTRARIMQTLHRRRRRKLLGWALFGPIGVLFIAGSAWAGARGAWSELWQMTAVVLGWSESQPVELALAEGDGEPVGETVRRVQRRTHRVIEATTKELEAPLPSESEVAPYEPTPEDEPQRAEAGDPGPASSSPSGPVVREPIEPAPTAAEPIKERDPEFVAFRRGHDLHFKRQAPEAAIAAYERYLTEYPNGRFVPEARYNLAINHIKLGQFERARALLEPFARGKFGDYRKRRAQELLDAL